MRPFVLQKTIEESVWLSSFVDDLNNRLQRIHCLLIALLTTIHQHLKKSCDNRSLWCADPEPSMDLQVTEASDKMSEAQGQPNQILGF